MTQIKSLYMSMALFLSVVVTYAQEKFPVVQNPPVSMEAFGGNRAFAYQLILNKKMQSVPKLGFFSVTNFQTTSWKSSKMNDYMIQGNLSYNFAKRLDVTAGFLWNPVDGIRPSAGLLYSYGTRDLLALANLRTDLTKRANTDILTLVEYKPKVTDKLNLYTRFQGLYTYNFANDFHTRSYIMLRAGLTYKDLSFGVANNFDFYGPNRVYENNLGAFVMINLF